MDVTYFFDPACPFTWRTSRWLVAVAPERNLTVRWRAFSLSILNGDDIPERYRAVAAASSRALRLVEALRADHRDDDVAAFYTEMGTRTHEAGTPLSDEIVVQAATAAGIADPEAVLDDASWDEAVRESHELAFGSAGPDIGSPVLLVEGAARAVHGPVIGDVPAREEALAIWDAVVPLARSDTFFTLQRGHS
ncbi:DsbA family protein [Couchioplanes caeruleus]|uniref:Uncharacterized protein n=2 Tax=Couchioplanes caeruleus TaxID=56438 RepID=A0A1K0FLQ7_9ACTN|nr:DsbA family protein [Couchioplanes caeruleus]OJF13664.1 hypothetical protein BG844_13915 [Couchioplanes caeruleus subsp. caeruleus]ROP28967.1 DSBA-like thioredoxin domain-containing protein [Couchioplanes caeruleus]